MVKSILIPISESDQLYKSVEFVNSEFSDISITILYVSYNNKSGDDPFWHYLSNKNDGEKRIDETFEEVKSKINTKNIKEINTRTRYGDASRQIVKYIKQNDIDLIVMRGSGRMGIPRVLFGSVSEYVVRHSTKPVLVL